jgi:hypothetical protein
MEWPQLALTFASAAGGFLSMAKLVKMMERRRGEGVAPRNTLFVNGEQDRVLARIDELITANRERRRQTEQVAEEVRVERRERIRDVEDIRGIIEQFARRIDAGGL